MTRITTFQAVGVLVATLMCFPAVCYAYNKTITRPTTTTEAITNGPTTKTASNLTTTGHKQTTASNMTTTGPTATTASNMTTTGHYKTTEINMKTTGPTTTAASNIKTTEAPTTPEPKTTAASNMTTESGTTSTTQSALWNDPLIVTVTPGGTASALEARWEVKDKNGKLCMIMDFGGTITDVNNGVIEQIPSDASTSRSDCSSSSHSAFVLDFNTPFTEWEIVLNFTTRGGSFELHTLSVNRTTLKTPLSSSQTTDFFHVSLGDYYTCSHFYYNLDFFQVNLTNPVLQPFVKETEGGDNFGQPYVCPPAHSDSHTSIIIVVTFPVTLILLLIVVGQRKNSSRGYINMGDPSCDVFRTCSGCNNCCC